MKRISLNRKSAKIVFVLVCIGIILFSGGYAAGQGGSHNFTIDTSAPFYPGAPAFTIGADGSGNYVAKDVNGLSSFPSTDGAITVNDAIQAAPYSTSIRLVGVITIQTTILVNRNISLYFDEIDLASSMNTDGIKISPSDVATPVGHSVVEGNTIVVYSTSWSAAAVKIENCMSVTVQVGDITYLGNRDGSTRGIGVEFYAGNGEHVIWSTLQNSKIRFFDKDVLYQVDGSGWMNSNPLSNVVFPNSGSVNLELYNNGGGIGGNIFTNLQMEPPNAVGGKYVYMHSSGTQSYPYIEFNSFIGYTPYDLTGSDTAYFADSSVRGTSFDSGFVNLQYWSDNGVNTRFNTYNVGTESPLVTVASATSILGTEPIYCPTNAGWSTSGSNGTGTTNTLQAPTFLESSTGATPASCSNLWAYAYMTGKYADAYPKTAITFAVSVHGDISQTDEIQYIQFKAGSTVGDLSVQGIGLKIVGNTIYGESFGSTYGTVSLGTITTSGIYYVRVVWQPTFVSFYVNSIVPNVVTYFGNLTTTSQIPTDISAPKLEVSALNGGNSQWVTVDVSNIEIYPNST